MPAKGTEPEPLTPRLKLFILLCVLFALWVGLLIFLYAATVYPMRHPAH